MPPQHMPAPPEAEPPGRQPLQAPIDAISARRRRPSATGLSGSKFWQLTLMRCSSLYVSDLTWHFITTRWKECFRKCASNRLLSDSYVGAISSAVRPPSSRTAVSSKISAPRSTLLLKNALAT